MRTSQRASSSTDASCTRSLMAQKDIQAKVPLNQALAKYATASTLRSNLFSSGSSSSTSCSPRQRSITPCRRTESVLETGPLLSATIQTSWQLFGIPWNSGHDNKHVRSTTIEHKTNTRISKKIRNNYHLIYMRQTPIFHVNTGIFMKTNQKTKSQTQRGWVSS